MGTININGKTYEGDSIIIVNDKVTIDGKPVEDGKPNKNGILKIKVTGDINSLKTDRDVDIQGSVFGNVSAGRNVDCGSVNGDVSAGRNIDCMEVQGNAACPRNLNAEAISSKQTTGAIQAGNIGSMTQTFS